MNPLFELIILANASSSGIRFSHAYSGGRSLVGFEAKCLNGLFSLSFHSGSIGGFAGIFLALSAF